MQFNNSHICTVWSSIIPGLVQFTILHNINKNLLFYLIFYFVGIVIGILSELSDVPIRSVSTKVVNNNDIGKMQSLIVIVEKLTPIISWNVFFKLYIKTHQSYPPAFFVAGLLIILIASLIVMYVCSCSLYGNPFGNIEFNFLCRIMYVIERRDKRKILTQEIMLN